MCSIISIGVIVSLVIGLFSNLFFVVLNDKYCKVIDISNCCFEFFFRVDIESVYCFLNGCEGDKLVGGD